MKRNIFICLFAITLFFPACANAFYKVIDLGTLGSYEVSGAYSINNNGQVVGRAGDGSLNWRAVLFDTTGNGNNIALSSGVTEAYSISNSGQIVGKQLKVTYGRRGEVIWYNRAILFDPTGKGKNVDLGTLGGRGSEAWSINDAGQIVGRAEMQFGVGFQPSHATLFDPSGKGNNIDLGTLGGEYSWANFINDCAQIVGLAATSAGLPHATLFDSTGGGKNIDLGTLGGDISIAYSINSNGQIVGYSADYDPSLPTHERDRRATLFDSTGGGNNIDLGILDGRESSAMSINDAGQIVGWAENRQSYHHATLFDPTGNGNNIDLNSLIDPTCGWTLIRAYSINDYGWIVGDGRNPLGEWHAYLLIPEPATIALLGLGILCLRKWYKPR